MPNVVFTSGRMLLGLTLSSFLLAGCLSTQDDYRVLEPDANLSPPYKIRPGDWVGVSKLDNEYVQFEVTKITHTAISGADTDVRFDQINEITLYSFDPDTREKVKTFKKVLIGSTGLVFAVVFITLILAF